MGEFHFVLVRQRISIEEVVKFPNAKAAVDTFVLGRKGSQIQGRNCPSSEERWNDSSLRDPDGPLSLENGRTCETPPIIQMTSCVPGDNVKDEEEYKAVVTEQGASTSQMTAAKFLDTIAKLLGMAGEASDAVSTDYRKISFELQRH